MSSVSRETDFLGIVNEHRGAIHRLARTYAHSEEDRAELFQEIVYQLWRAQPAFRREASALTWVYRIALNTAITFLRRQGRRPKHVDLAQSRELAAPERTVDARAELLHAAIRKLGDIDRAVVMCYLDGLSYEQIGEVLGMSATNIGARLSRARARLRDLIKDLE
jgi:RNA polymerase sigma-70 factor, ECF subfamily